MSAALDLVNALDLPTWAASALGVTLDEWQAEAARSPSRRMLLNCSRQSGKSTLCVLLALRCAVFRPGTLTLIAAPSERQSGEAFRTLAAFLPQVSVGVAEQTQLSVRLENNSRVLAVPQSADRIRGFAAHLVIVDEAARVSDDILVALRPSLSTTNGTLILASTPRGRRGAFFDYWSRGEEWTRVEVPASACPRIDPGFLESEKRALGPVAYRSEYECSFEDNAQALFDHEVLDALIDPGVAPLFAPDGHGHPGVTALEPLRVILGGAA